MTDLTRRIVAQFEASAQLKIDLAESLPKPILAAAECIVNAVLQEKKILICGNGGSAANAQYFASRMLNHYQMERPGLAAIALSADAVSITAIANQGRFDQVYSKQVAALGLAGDVLLAISCSGHSKNVLKAIETAKDHHMQIIAMCGGDDRSLLELLSAGDVLISVPHDNPYRVEEVYILILHCLCDAIDCILLGVNE